MTHTCIRCSCELGPLDLNFLAFKTGHELQGPICLTSGMVCYACYLWAKEKYAGRASLVMRDTIAEAKAVLDQHGKEILILDSF